MSATFEEAISNARKFASSSAACTVGGESHLGQCEGIVLHYGHSPETAFVQLEPRWIRLDITHRA